MNNTIMGESMSMIEHNTERNKKEEWEQMNKVISLVRSFGGFSEFARQKKDEVSGFLNKQDHVCCIDERIPHTGAVSVAGSGILIKDNPKALDVLIKSLKEKDIKRVCMHENCGAVGLYAKAKGISLDVANEEAMEWAKKLTSLIGGHDVPEVLPVDIGFHNAQCAYVMFEDASGIGKSFPRGFEISSCVSFLKVLEQIKVSIDIALGDHGFGELFTEGNPFTVVTVAKNNDLYAMENQPDLVQLVAQYNGKAVIDGFAV